MLILWIQIAPLQYDSELNIPVHLLYNNMYTNYYIFGYKSCCLLQYNRFKHTYFASADKI